jgi:predicted dienelactone hydrolase
MRLTFETSSGGVREQIFTLAEIPGVLWTPEGAAGPRPLILMGHGGGQHKKAPAIVAAARRFVTEHGFAVAAVDVPGHGDRPAEADYNRIATEKQARVKAGAELAPLMAGFQALVARQTVPEWRAVLDAVQALGHVGAGPAGCGSSPATWADTAACRALRPGPGRCAPTRSRGSAWSVPGSAP